MNDQPKTENRKPETVLSGREYLGLKSIIGPLLVVTGVRGVGFDESVEVTAPDGSRQTGRVLAVGQDEAVIELFGETVGLSLQKTRVRFTGSPLTAPVSTDLLGRIFNGMGQPLDGGPQPVGEASRDINGQPINPTARTYPQEFIQTGISAIDGMNTLVRGQKLPIFAMSGLPHNELAAQIVRQARLLGEEGRFAIVFAAMGVQHDVANIFRQSFEASGVLNNVVMFLNLASDPAIERLVTPRLALTVAEFLAFDRDHHVLAILTDMTNYCEALREVASSKGEVPSRKGYPGYLYSDLASIYERAGKIEGRSRLHHPVAHAHHAQRRHHPPHPGPHRLHHRRPDRLGPGPAPAGHLPAHQRAAVTFPADERRHRRRPHPGRPQPRVVATLRRL